MQAEHKTFHMNIVDVEHFEEKLRMAEKSLGIQADAGVPLVYERNQESTWLLLASLIAVALMILLMFRSGTIKTPQAMDFFVRAGKPGHTEDVSRCPCYLQYLPCLLHYSQALSFVMTKFFFLLFYLEH